jgi:hypothetical protein
VCTAIVLAAVLSWIGPAGAVDAERGIAERGSKAPLVVVGEPIGQSSRWEDGGIWTYTEVAVRRRLGAEAAKTIVVRQRGGTVGRIGQRVTHLRLVDATRPHLLLLWQDAETGLWSPVAEGVLPIEIDLAGEERVEGVRLATVLRLLESLR